MPVTWRFLLCFLDGIGIPFQGAPNVGFAIEIPAVVKVFDRIDLVILRFYN